MSRLVITTVGTSIIEKYVRAVNPAKRLYENEIEGKEIEEYTSRVERFKTDVTEFVRETFDLDITKGPSETDNRLSAEIASLRIMHNHNIITPVIDNIALLYSDTLEGKLAADINEEILRSKAQFPNISQVNLPGIRGRDAGAFERAVNDDSIANILQDINGQTPNPCLICFSGGYKGILPIVARFAQPNRINMYYLYEKSDSVVEYNYDVNGGLNARQLAYRR